MKLSRRELIRDATLSALGTAAVGCAAMPEIVGRRGSHPCDHVHCRYWAAPRGGSRRGTCKLASRERGGTP
ncbi:MAG: hypothetical protein HYY06_15030 [Deltaproteobacteria bacterium]|nr:hypothetical protein [Deltaproteobacteria bacterium]